MGKAKVITICGSMKFVPKIKEETEKLTLEGNCVLSIIKDRNLIRLKLSINSSMHRKVFSHLINLPYKFFDIRNKSGILYSLNNISVIREAFTNNIISGIIDFGSLLFILSYIALDSKILALIVIGLAIVNVIIVIFARKNLPKITKNCYLKKTEYTISKLNVYSLSLG